jgi:hypothetical protein
MSTLTVSDLPLDTTAPAQRLRRAAAAVRVHFTWWGTHKSLSPKQKEQAGAAYAADARLLTAGKKLLDTRHEAFRALTCVRTRLTSYWRGLTLPYTEPGVRLIRQSDVEVFDGAMRGFRDELAKAVGGLVKVYGAIKKDAQDRLGTLYDEADYPADLTGLFAVEWDFPSVEPPAYLMRVAPEVYAQEQERVARRFEEAVRLAEEAFVSEFAQVVAHLAERLAPDEGGERKVFRDSAVTNLLDFFERFRRLNVRSSEELDALVDQAQQLVRNVTPGRLRNNDELRGRVAADLAAVQARLDGLIVSQPRRRIIRATPPPNGGGHAPGG